MVIQVYFLFTLVDNTTWFNSNFQTTKKTRSRIRIYRDC